MTKVSILGVCVNPLGADRAAAGSTGEYVLLGCNGNTKDLEIQHLVYPAHGPAYFDTWCHIREDLPPRVTELLVRGGEGSTCVEGARQTVHTGDRRARLNNKQGEHLRVVDRHGKILAELEVPGDRCDVIPAPPKQPGVIPPIIRPSIPAAAAFGEVH